MNFFKGAGQAYGLGQRFAFPSVFMLGPPKTSTTSIFECITGGKRGGGLLGGWAGWWIVFSCLLGMWGCEG